MASRNNTKLKKFLRDFVVGVFETKDEARGPYRHWVAAANENGFIPVQAILDVGTVKRSLVGQPHLPEVLITVLQEKPFELSEDGTQFRVKPAAPARSSANIWRNFGRKKKIGNASAPEFVPSWMRGDAAGGEGDVDPNAYAKRIVGQFDPSEGSTGEYNTFSNKVWKMRRTRRNRKRRVNTRKGRK